MEPLGRGARALRDGIAAGAIDPREAAEAALAAIDSDHLNCFIEVRGRAVEEAAAASGPLAGVPVGLKDMFGDEGRAPTMASHARPSWLTGTAEVVRRLRAAGATIVGYTNLHEWAVGMTSLVSAYGPVVNPLDPARVAGGSSGGSAAAVASGLVPLAIGSDAGGSIRCPAACCGVVGMKPTHGLVPLRGYIEDGNPIDHVGPIAGSVEDAALLLEVLSGASIALSDTARLRVGVARGFFTDDIAPEVEAGLEAAVRAVESFARATDVEVAHAHEGATTISLLHLPISLSGVSATGDDWIERLQPETARLMMMGAGMGEAEAREAEAMRGRVRAGWEAAFEEVDVVLTPTLPGLPAPVESRAVELPSGLSSAEIAYLGHCAPMNVAGIPALTLPCGDGPGDLTVSVTISGPRGSDALVLSAGRALENAL